MSLLLEKARRHLDLINVVLVGTLTCYAIWRSYSCFSADWDFIAYHLPGALKHFNLSTFQANSKIQAVLAGFPPLPHYLQGLMVWLSGRVESAQLLSLLGLFFFVIAQRIVLPGLSINWFATALCSVPLFVVHVTSGYVDLWSNVMLTIAFMVLLADDAEKRSTSLLAVLLLSTSAAVLSKYQAWPLAVVFAAAGACKFRFLPPSRLFLWGVMFTVCLSSWAVRNSLLHGNPTYPVIPPFIGSALSIEFDGEPSLTNASGHSKNIPKQLRNSAQSQRFFVSMFELTRLTREAERFAWRIDQASPRGSDSYHHRMGGFFWLTMLVLIGANVYLFQHEERSRFPLAVLGITVLIVSSLPQSHELRYYMCIPFIGSLILLHFDTSFSPAGRAALRLSFLFLALWVLVRISPPGTCQRHIDYAPADAKEYWSREVKPQSCVTTSYDRALFFSGPSFSEFQVTHCR